MRVLAVIAEKGGAGKSTISTNLAVEFTRQGVDTAVIDLDPQATVAKWADRRKNALPMVVSAHATRLDHEIKRIAEDGCKFLILDTAPHSDSIALAAAGSADCVLVVTKPAIFDIETVQKTIDLVKTQNRSIVLLLNEVGAPRETVNGHLYHTRETIQAFDYLRELDAVVCPTPLARRVVFKRAPFTGLGVQEFSYNNKKASDEIANVHAFLCTRMNIKFKQKGGSINA